MANASPSNYNPGQELSELDFSSLIGGPLGAIVDAQSQAALTTVDFVKEVGFEKDEQNAIGDPIYVEFKYPKVVTPYQPAQGENPAVEADIRQMKLEVPILTMMPIPFIRVEEGTIDFQAKINSMEYQTVGKTVKAGFGLGVKRKSVNLKVSASYQKNTRQGSQVKKTYHMGVHVKVVQDEMPEGMEKLLGILEGAILSEPISATTGGE